MKVPRFPLGVRAVNKRGQVISNDAVGIKLLVETGMKSPSAESYVEQAMAALAELARRASTLRLTPARKSKRTLANCSRGRRVKHQP